MDGTGKKRLRVRSEEGRFVILNLFKIKMKKKRYVFNNFLEKITLISLFSWREFYLFALVDEERRIAETEEELLLGGGIAQRWRLCRPGEDLLIIIREKPQPQGVRLHRWQQPLCHRPHSANVRRTRQS